MRRLFSLNVTSKLSKRSDIPCSNSVIFYTKANYSIVQVISEQALSGCVENSGDANLVGTLEHVNDPPCFQIVEQ